MNGIESEKIINELRTKLAKADAKIKKITKELIDADDLVEDFKVKEQVMRKKLRIEDDKSCRLAAQNKVLETQLLAIQQPSSMLAETAEVNSIVHEKPNLKAQLKQLEKLILELNTELKTKERKLLLVIKDLKAKNLTLNAEGKQLQELLLEMSIKIAELEKEPLSALTQSGELVDPSLRRETKSEIFRVKTENAQLENENFNLITKDNNLKSKNSKLKTEHKRLPEMSEKLNSKTLVKEGSSEEPALEPKNIALTSQFTVPQPPKKRARRLEDLSIEAIANSKNQNFLGS